MAERYVCLQPEYINEFQCDGTSCEGKCCKIWKISIDDVTRKKYGKMKPKGVRKEILSHIKRKEERYYIKLRSDGTCPFLLENHLCRLQRDYGEAYLSATCRTYPRVTNIVNGLMERSLSLTCPVAARLVLLQREPMTFEQREILVDRPTHARTLNGGSEVSHLPELQYAGISLLQDRRYSIDQRLILLGFFTEQAQELESMEHLEDLVRFYASEEIGEHAPEMFRAIRFRPEQYIKTMFGLLESLYGTKSELDVWEVWLDCVTRVFGLSEEHYEVSVGELLGAYERSWLPVHPRLMEKYGHVIENYLVNEFFSNMYPCGTEGTLVQNFSLFLLSYKFFEFVLGAIAADKGDALQEDMLVSVMGNFSGRLDHAPAYMNHVKKEAWKRDSGVADVLKALVNA